MRLRDLDAEFIRAPGGGDVVRTGEDGTEAQGVAFTCPREGHGHRVVIWFSNPVPPGLPVPPEYSPRPRWEREGETIDELTIAPSILVWDDQEAGEVDWHGYIMGGWVH